MTLLAWLAGIALAQDAPPVRVATTPGEVSYAIVRVRKGARTAIGVVGLDLRAAGIVTTSLASLDSPNYIELTLPEGSDPKSLLSVDGHPACVATVSTIVGPTAPTWHVVGVGECIGEKKKKKKKRENEAAEVPG